MRRKRTVERMLWKLKRLLYKTGSPDDAEIYIAMILTLRWVLGEDAHALQQEEDERRAKQNPPQGPEMG